MNSQILIYLYKCLCLIRIDTQPLLAERTDRTDLGGPYTPRDLGGPHTPGAPLKAVRSVTWGPTPSGAPGVGLRRCISLRRGHENVE